MRSWASSRRGAVALVEAVGAAAASAVGDHHGDMGERVAQQIGKVVERVAHELLEVVVVERIELHELAFFGIDGEPFPRELLGVAHELIELLSDSGSRQPAIRTARNAAPPISAAARITPRATSSSALTAPTELKPWPSTDHDERRPTSPPAPRGPTRRRCPGALVTRSGRRIEPAYCSVRAITSRWISFVPS